MFGKQVCKSLLSLAGSQSRSVSGVPQKHVYEDLCLVRTHFGVDKEGQRSSRSQRSKVAHVWCHRMGTWRRSKWLLFRQVAPSRPITLLIVLLFCLIFSKLKRYVRYVFATHPSFSHWNCESDRVIWKDNNQPSSTTITMSTTGLFVYDWREGDLGKVKKKIVDPLCLPHLEWQFFTDAPQRVGCLGLEKYFSFCGRKFSVLSGPNH